MVVWTSIGAAFLFIEMDGAGPELPWWEAFKTRFAPRPKFHVVPKMHSSRSAETDVFTPRSIRYSTRSPSSELEV